MMRLLISSATIGRSFAETLPQNLAVGHAGAIIENGIGKAAVKRQKLKEAGASGIVEYPLNKIIM